MGIPIIVEDNFLATLFIGQVFFENPDLEYFKKQANIRRCLLVIS